MNGCGRKLDHLDHLQATMNSYLGLLKKKNEFKNIVRLWESVDDGWKRYAEMDWDRLCVVAKEGFRHNDFINYKFRRILS